jgi:hypothetical protein
MEGLSIIESQTLKEWKERLFSLEQNQLFLIKLVQQLMPPLKHSSIPDFISIADACEKYHLSRVSINNKIKLFKKEKKREIDRMQSGNYYLINEAELQEAIRIKGNYLP